MTENKDIWPENALEMELDDDILRSSNEDIVNRTKLLENDIKVRCSFIHVEFGKIMKSETLRLSHEQAAMKDKIKDNEEKVKLNKQLPYLVANVVEVFSFFLILTL